MNSDEVRKGVTQAKFNEDNSGVLVGETFIVSAALGLLTGSWWVFGAVFLLLLFLIFGNKKIAVIICYIFAIGWGAAGFGIGILFNSLGASIVLAILGFLAGLGANLSSLEWVNDI